MLEGWASRRLASQVHSLELDRITKARKYENTKRSASSRQSLGQIKGNCWRFLNESRACVTVVSGQHANGRNFFSCFRTFVLS
jgi:hypothetical protein